MMANTLSEVAVTSSVGLQTPGPSPHLAVQSPGSHHPPSAVVLPTPVVAQCYDRDKQAWTIKSDCHSETVRLHMVYKDIHNVARNHLRYYPNVVISTSSSWIAWCLKMGTIGFLETSVTFYHFTLRKVSEKRRYIYWTVHHCKSWK